MGMAMKKGDPLVYKYLSDESDGWTRYVASELFELSVPPDTRLIPIRCGDAALNWTVAGLTLRLIVNSPNAPSGLAAPYAADMYYLAREEVPIEVLVSEFESKLETNGAKFDIEWIGSSTGQIPVISCLHDENTLEITNLFVHGGCWEFTHGIGCNDPMDSWPEIVQRIATSVKFICKKDECRNLVYLEPF